MHNSLVDEQQTSNISPNYASFIERALAILIDNLLEVSILLVGVVMIVLFNFARSSFQNPFLVNGSVGDIATVVFVIVTLLGFFLYPIVCWVKFNGQTLGKKLMNIKVEPENGSPINYKTAIVRDVSYWISGLIFDLGYFWMLWDAKKQCWHDKLAKTVVVRVEGRSTSKLSVISVVILLLAVCASLFTLGYYLSKSEQTRINNAYNRAGSADQLIQNACLQFDAANSLLNNKNRSPEDTARMMSLTQGAIVDLKSATQSEPNNAKAYYYLGFIYQDLANLQVSGAGEQAQLYGLRAKALDPNTANYGLCR